jgi:hypothetical protein
MASRDEAQADDRSDKALHEATRYLVWINGGGAVAASAFLGATVHTGQILKWGALPLLLFYVGLMAAAGLWIGNLFYHWTKEHVPPEAVEMVASKTLAARMGQWADHLCSAVFSR